MYKELDKFVAPKFEFFLVEGVGRATDDPKSDQFRAILELLWLNL